MPVDITQNKTTLEKKNFRCACVLYVSLFFPAVARPNKNLYPLPCLPLLRIYAIPAALAVSSDLLTIS
jgi:hypothetical protein